MTVAAAIVCAAARMLPVALVAPPLGGPLGWAARLVVGALLVGLVAPALVGRPGEASAAAVAREALVGLFMAVIVAAPFWAARAGGALVDRARGARDRAVETAYGLLALALFAAVGGPRLVVVGVAESYAALPALAPLDAGAGLQVLVEAGGRIVASGIAVAAPVLAAALLAELVMAAVARAQPALADAVGVAGVRTLVAVVVVGLSVLAAVQALGLGQVADGLGGALKRLAGP